MGSGFQLRGSFRLEKAVWQGPLAFREGVLKVEGAPDLELSLSHSPATERFIYLGDYSGQDPVAGVLDTLGLSFPGDRPFQLPGQLVLGAHRTRLTEEGVRDCLSSPSFKSLLENSGSGETMVFPVLREGMKYGLSDAVLSISGCVCDEIVVDAHHVPDPSVPDLGRRMELKVFKDKDLTDAEKAAVKVAVVGDSVASGTVIIGLVDELTNRFPNLERIELVAPLAAVYGLARIAHFSRSDVKLRIHCFETLLNALPPDYYYSPHYAEPEMHFRPEAQEAYRQWWGQDKAGNWIADTACSGYGWSEAFFNPGKQLRMIEEELQKRHGISLQEIVKRSIC